MKMEKIEMFLEHRQREENGEIDIENKTEKENSWEEYNPIYEKTKREDETEGNDGTIDISVKYFY